MHRKNIVLIGMPGAGKSTLGVILAKTLGMSFLDTDLAVQEAEGRLLQEIIDDEGREEFLKIEERILLGIHTVNSVIATGGSAVYSAQAIRQLKNEGSLIYLKLPFPELEKRINNMMSRGIAMEKGESLNDVYNERIPLYERYADITLDCSNTTIEETVQAIVNHPRIKQIMAILGKNYK